MDTCLSPSKYCYTWNSRVILENNTCHADETCTPSYSQCIVNIVAHGLIWCLQLWREWTKIVRRMVCESSWGLFTISILVDHHVTWAANIGICYITSWFQVLAICCCTYKARTVCFCLGPHTLLKMGTNSHPWHVDFAVATSWYSNPVFSGKVCCAENKAAILFNRDRPSTWTEQQSRKRRWWGGRFVAKPKSSIALDGGGTGTCEGYWRVWGQLPGWRCRENYQDQSQAPWAYCVCTSQICHWGWCSHSSTWR